MADAQSKLYYTISEVSDLTGVKAHVLRYWESEFPSLRPRKGRAGSRRYRQVDIDEIRTIASLLYEQGYKIAGARKLLAKRHRTATPAEPARQMAIGFDTLSGAEKLAVVRKELTEVRDLVRDLGAAAAPKKRQAKA